MPRVLLKPAAYRITLDRTVGEHRLPEYCIVIAAGGIPVLWRINNEKVTPSWGKVARI